LTCAHGEGGRGAWQPRATPTHHLVDSLRAAPVVCELDGTYGVQRRFFTSVGQLHEAAEAQAGAEVVPNINQTSSVYDAAHFRGHLRIDEAGRYALSVEVVGKFLLSVEESPVLAGRSRGHEPELFTAATAHFVPGYYMFHLQYEFDPLQVGGEGTAPIFRHVRLLWQAEDVPGLEALAVVPPFVLHHSFRDFAGFPRIIDLVNDPNQCDSYVDNGIGLNDLKLHDTGIISDGTTGRMYNPSLTCTWRLYSAALRRFTFSVGDYFQLEATPDCIGDRLEILFGDDAERWGAYCGDLAPGEIFASLPGMQTVWLRFVTDRIVEREGLHIRYTVEPAEAPPPPGVATEPS